MSDPIVIPTVASRPAITRNPQTLTIYGPDHVGKTDSVRSLPGSVVILELQRDGGDHLAGPFHDLHQLVDKGEYGKGVSYEDAFFATLENWGARNVAGNPIADFVVFDRIDRMEDWVFARALKTFRATAIGRSDKFKNAEHIIDDLPGPTGSPGWRFVREEMHRTMWMMKKCAKHIVLVCGMRDKLMLSATPKVAGDAMATDLDLTGSLRKLVCNDSSTFGFMYRNPSNSDLMLNFKAGGSAACGTYCNHLRGKEITLGKVNAAGDTICDWSQVYKPDAPAAPAP